MIIIFYEACTKLFSDLVHLTEKTHATEEFLMPAAIDGKVTCFCCLRKYDVEVAKKATVRQQNSMYVPLPAASQSLLCYACTPMWGNEQTKSNPSDFGQMIRRWMPVYWATHKEWRCCNPYDFAGCEGLSTSMPTSWQQYSHGSKKGVMCFSCRKQRDTLRKKALGCSTFKQRLGIHMHAKYVDADKVENAIHAYLKNKVVTHPREVLNKDGAEYLQEAEKEGVQAPAGADSEAAAAEDVGEDQDVTIKEKKRKRSTEEKKQKKKDKKQKKKEKKSEKRRKRKETADEDEEAEQKQPASEQPPLPVAHEKTKKRVRLAVEDDEPVVNNYAADTSSSSSERQNDPEDAHVRNEEEGHAEPSDPSEQSEEPVVNTNQSLEGPVFTDRKQILEGEELVMLTLIEGDEEIQSKFKELSELIDKKTKEREDTLRETGKPAPKAKSYVECAYYEFVTEETVQK